MLQNIGAHLQREENMLIRISKSRIKLANAFLVVAVDENGNTKVVGMNDQLVEDREEITTESIPDVASPSAVAPKLEGKELMEQLQRQLEYYFSRYIF